MSTHQRRGPWSAGIVAVALLTGLPVLVIVGFVLVPSGDAWQHLVDTVLADYVINTLLLMLGVAIGTLVGGVGTAWLTSMCRFPGRGLFEWALILPMAMP
ncbi:MAG: iron ABC transporter permease, partial [Gammaproteobacteria bacterium]|nr:iron ABC transporter permease [Gammaproteobacteria bacterium]